jgi:hypothetical protein
VLHRWEQDRRVRGILVLSEDGADKPVLRDCDKYDDPINRALNDLADRMDAGRQEWLTKMLCDPDER